MSSLCSRKRRHVDVEDVEPVIKIAAQFAGGDRIVRNLIGGGEHAHIDRSFHFAAQTPQLVVFEHAQQLGLRAHRHFADFVEQDRAAFGQLEAAGAPFESSGEGALFVAEDFAFDQGFRNGCAIDGDERPLAARTQLMDGARHQFFAGAAGPGNQHRRGAGRNQFDQPENLLHLARRPAQLAERAGIAQLAAGALQFGAGAHQRGRILQHGAQALGVDGFGDVVIGSHAHGLHGAVDRALRGHQNHGHGLRSAPPAVRGVRCRPCAASSGR